MHIDALMQFGAREVESDHGLRTLSLPGGRFRGTSHTLAYPSVGATEQFLLAAVLAKGHSELRNAAIEPEIMNLVDLLQRMGASITKLPRRSFRIVGVEQLHPAEITVIPDRLEAASWGCAALATDGRITVQGVVQEHLSAFLDAFQQAGGKFEFSADGSEVTFSKGARVEAVQLETDVHPGFMTDWQPSLVSARTQAMAVTILHETVYEDRLGYLAILEGMGAHVTPMTQCLGQLECRYSGGDHVHSAVIVGARVLNGNDFRVPDLRGGFAYLIAALTAIGESKIEGFEVLNRGYADLVNKLHGVGARIDIKWSKVIDLG